MERILTLHKLPVIMLHPVLFRSICQAEQAVICPFILVHIFVRLIHQVIEAFSAGLTPSASDGQPAAAGYRRRFQLLHTLLKLLPAYPFPHHQKLVPAHAEDLVLRKHSS